VKSDIQKLETDCPELLSELANGPKILQGLAMRAFISIDPQLFFKGPRKEDPRLGDSARAIHEEEVAKAKPGFVLAGYPDEEGIRLSHGRPGAKEAPDRIRSYFYRATHPAKSLPPLYDLGNLETAGSLADRHEYAKATALSAFSHGHRWIALGGGHDYGYADVAAFLLHCRKVKKRGLVLHFDAHLDCRPDDQGLNSGTPFYRVLNEFPPTAKKMPYDLIAVGLQRVCNSATYLGWADKKKVQLIFADEIEKARKLLKLHLKSKRPVFISLDMDVFSSAYAPGTSNNWPMGLEPRELLPLFTDTLKKSQVLGMGIYEVSPPNDVENITSKLAAQYVYEFVRS
jgi:formiminoglutamase